MPRSRLLHYISDRYLAVNVLFPAAPVRLAKPASRSPIHRVLQPVLNTPL
jgi:hypothetical protein